MCRFLSLLLVLAACSSGGDPLVGASQMVGPGGGQVVSADGKLTLTIPAGALPADTEITVRELTRSELGPEWQGVDIEAAYELGPDGLVFQQPVAVTLRLAQSPTGPGGILQADGVVLVTESGAGIEPTGSQVLAADADAGVTVLTGEIGHFSRLAGVDSGFHLEIGGVPDSMGVYDSFTVTLNVRVDPAATASGFLTVEVLGYEPLLPPKQPLILNHTAIAPGDSFDVTHGPYECSSGGSGDFDAHATVEAFGMTLGLDKFYLNKWEVTLTKSINHDEEARKQRIYDVAVLETEAILGFDHVPSGLFPNDVTVAGKDAWAIVDTNTGEEKERLTTPGATYGALPLGDDQAPAVFAFGSWGAWLYQWEVDKFGTPDPISTNNITDATPTPDGGLLFVDHTLGEVGFLRIAAGKGYVTNETMKLPEVVSAVELPDGFILAVTGDDPGKLYGAAGWTAPFAEIGHAGSAPRRVRALGDVAAISSFGSGIGFGGITIASRQSGTWGIDFALVGPSSVGIDLKEGQNGDVLVAATSYKANQYRVIEVEPDGAYVWDGIFDLPAGNEGPGHALWLPSAFNELAITCHDSSTLVVTPVTKD